MRQQRKTFRAIEVGDGGDGRWAAYARGLWQEMEGLLTEEGRTPEGADRVRALFRAHLPELVPVLDRLAGRLDRPEAEAFLTHAALRPFSQGCTQIGRNGTLLRNYDLRPDQCEGTIVSSCFLRPVIGMQDMLWGLLDGMNDASLAVSLTWGGRSVYGRGFAILVVVRYLLETCDTVVAYKFGRVAEETLAVVRDAGRLDDAVYGARLGLPDEDVRAAKGLEGPVPYLSTLIVPGRRTTTGGKLRGRT